MSIQFTELEFKPVTFKTWVSSYNHKTKAPFHTTYSVRGDLRGTSEWGLWAV